MLQVLVYLAALGPLAAAVTEETNFGKEGQANISSCPILFYGQLYNNIYVNLTQETVAMCFKGPHPATADNDCLLIKLAGQSKTRVKLKENINNVGSSYHKEMPSHVFNSTCYTGVRVSGTGGLEIYFRQFKTQSSFFVYIGMVEQVFTMVVGGAQVESFKKTTRLYKDLTGCRHAGVFYRVNEVVCGEGDGPTQICTPEGTLSETTPCPKQTTCTVIGSRVINIFKSVTSVPDRCAYTLLSQPGVRLLAVFRDRRRQDVGMLDRVILQLNGSGVQITLGQGGRLQVNNEAPWSLGSWPLTLPGVNVTRSQSGVTATFLFSNRTAAVFFDGSTAQIHMTVQPNTTVPGLCFSSSGAEGDVSPEFSSSSCDRLFLEPADETINCTTVAERCSVLREAPFASCHNHTDPEPFIRACRDTLCEYPSVDGVSRCQFLEAYVKACDFLTNGSLEGWRLQVGCAPPPASCQDVLCSDHEFCAEDINGGTRCACRAIFASKYISAGVFGEPTVCDDNSASVTLVGCLLGEIGVHHSDLHLNDQSCRGHVDNVTNMVTFSFDSSDACGTVVERNNSQLIYKNSIMASNISDVITRRDQFIIDFSCFYQQPDAKTVGFRIRDTSVIQQIVSGPWSYTLTMKTFSDAGRTQAIGPSMEIQLQQRVWVELKTDGLDDNLVSVVTDSCWATSEPSATSSQRYYLIIAGCANPADLTVQVETNGLGTSNYFSFDMFQFSGRSADVYLHCKLNLCVKKGNTCAPGCGGGAAARRRRRSARATSDDGSSAFITMAWTN